MEKHFVITTCGTSGDIFPFIELGKYLLSKKYEVSFVTNPIFENVVTSTFLNFIPFGTMEQGLSILNDPAMWHPKTGFNVLWAKTIQPNTHCIRLYIQSLDHRKEVVVLCHPALMALADLARSDRDDLKIVLFYLYPLIIRTHYRRLALGGTMILPQNCPKALRTLLYSLLDAKFFDVGIVPELNIERQRLGLQKIKHLFPHIQTAADLYVTLFPEWYAPTKRDYPKPLIKGDFVLYASPDDDLSDELKKFLAAGEPPILFTAGTGNPPAKQSDFFGIAVDVVTKLNARAVFLTRCRDQLPANLPDSMLWQRYAPFSKIMPRVSIVVHHGGIGTLAHATKAAVPQVVVPSAYDQFDNAMILAELGVGQSIPIRLLTRNTLFARLSRIRSSSKIKERCIQVSSNYRSAFEVDQIMERVVATI
jgi:rhamnosyltransferase subunit B